MDVPKRLKAAIQHFWAVRTKQGEAQSGRGVIDQGARSQVTGGAQMDGLINLVHDLLVEDGCAKDNVFTRPRMELPGYFRPTNQWDLIVVTEKKLPASLEFKPQ